MSTSGTLSLTFSTLHVWVLAVFLQRNRESSLIILYDEDERLSAATASQFIEKGYSNMYILDGGESLLAHI